MGAQKTEMHRLQDVVRLHRLGASARRIAKQISMGRDTIRIYLAVLSQAAPSEEPVDSLPEIDEARTLVLEQIDSSEPTAQQSSVERFEDEIMCLRRLALLDAGGWHQRRK